MRNEKEGREGGGFWFAGSLFSIVILSNPRSNFQIQNFGLSSKADLKIF